ncbi:MAG TPA: hypothetical protein VGG10_07200 [Rhizomicrobium sp.]|jgi:hypothetical protein
MARGLKKRRKRSIEADTEIDGFKLHWSLRSEPQRSAEHGSEGLSVSVERIDGSFRELILQYPIAMVERWGMLRPAFYPQRPKISPKTVEASIRQALAGGWNPDSRGKPFVFDVPENSN